MEAPDINKKDIANAEDHAISLIVFKLGDEEYGVRIHQVKEVTHTPAITRMPRTAKFIRGVANVRGDIIAIMDLEERFDVMTRTIQDDLIKNSYTLVVERENYTIGIAVKQVPQTLTLYASQIDKTPALLQDMHINEKYIEGIGKIDKRLIIVLDIFKILSFEEESNLASGNLKI